MSTDSQKIVNKAWNFAHFLRNNSNSFEGRKESGIASQATDCIESTIEQSLKRAARLRQSILKRAFEGKLVPQDTADEPASTLLERIRAGRDTIDRAGKPSRKEKKHVAHDHD